MAQIIGGREFLHILCKTMGFEDAKVRRIVLDVGMDDVVLVYVELFGDDRLLNVSTTLDGVRINVKSVASMSGMSVSG